MATIDQEVCTLLYVCDAYFTAADLAQLYCAHPNDNYGVIVYVEEDIDDLDGFSAGAQVILRVADPRGVAWLRLTPDREPFENVPLPGYSHHITDQTIRADALH